MQLSRANIPCIALAANVALIIGVLSSYLQPSTPWLNLAGTYLGTHFADSVPLLGTQWQARNIGLDHTPIHYRKPYLHPLVHLNPDSLPHNAGYDHHDVPPAALTSPVAGHRPPTFVLLCAIVLLGIAAALLLKAILCKAWSAEQQLMAAAASIGAQSQEHTDSFSHKGSCRMSTCSNEHCHDAECEMLSNSPETWVIAGFTSIHTDDGYKALRLAKLYLHRGSEQNGLCPRQVSQDSQDMVTLTGRKLNVVFLHGYTMSANRMEAAVRPLTAQCADIANFYFMDGPYAIDASDQLAKTLGAPIFSDSKKWNQDSQPCSLGGFSKQLQEFVDKQVPGPVDVVFGYSQGGIVLGCVLSETRHIAPQFQSIRGVGWFHSRLNANGQIGTDLHALKSFHVIGQKDSIMKPEGSESVAKLFKKPVIVRHDVAHWPFVDALVVKGCRGFLKSLHKDYAQSPTFGELASK